MSKSCAGRCRVAAGGDRRRAGHRVHAGLTSERDLFERNFVWLFWVNVAVAGPCCWSSRASVRLLLRVRRRSSAAGCSSSWRASSRWSASCRHPDLHGVGQFVSRSIESLVRRQSGRALDARLSLSAAARWRP
jgi:hypothetical protein